MFDYKHYVPILKGKQSECLALEQVDINTKSGMTPLIEIQSVSQSKMQNLSLMAKRIEKSWGIDKPLFIDVDREFLMRRTKDAITVLNYVLNNARNKGINFIPVTGLNRDASYQAAVLANIQQDKNGLCIRLENKDVGNSTQLTNNLSQTLNNFSVPESEVDILLDLGTFTPLQGGVVLSGVATIINNLPHLPNWRTLTVAGTAFPKSLGAFPPVTASATPRSEWINWQAVITNPQVKRLPSFGDYTVVYPEMPEIDFQLVPIAAKIKYATDSDWLILRWRTGRRYGWDRFYDLCDILVNNPEYRGQGFSWGDQRIYSCANRTVSPGNPAMWVRISVNHHLTVVARQVSSYP